jgi:hypothetical protein
VFALFPQIQIVVKASSWQKIALHKFDKVLYGSLLDLLQEPVNLGRVGGGYSAHDGNY